MTYMDLIIHQAFPKDQITRSNQDYAYAICNTLLNLSVTDSWLYEPVVTLHMDESYWPEGLITPDNIQNEDIDMEEEKFDELAKDKYDMEMNTGS